MNERDFPFFTTDWVDVANDLLSKCHVNLRLKKLTDCNADVFIALYENILGEKVPGKRKLQIWQMSACTFFLSKSIKMSKCLCSYLCNSVS